jgi:AmmeMemoRadiSam system protein B
MNSITRRPFLATYFSATRRELLQDIENCYVNEYGPCGSNKTTNDFTMSRNKLKALIVPHGAYIDAGPITAHGYYHLSQCDLSHIQTIVLLGTNHFNSKYYVTMSKMDQWCTPLECVPVNHEMNNHLLSQWNKRSSSFKSRNIFGYDDTAHTKEHSIENQLPFLQHLYQRQQTQFTIVPLAISYLTNSEVVSEVAATIYDTLKDHPNTFVVATTDFTHAGRSYGELPDPSSKLTVSQYTVMKDEPVLKAIEEGDSKSLISTVLSTKSSMCGLGAASVMLELANLFDWNRIKLLSYAPSDRIFKREDVNGFASFGIFAE